MEKATILITGAGPNGVTGRRIKEDLENSYNILSPSSKELNLVNSQAVDEFFASHKIDYIIHSAVMTPSRGNLNSSEYSEVEDNLRMYFNLAKQSKDFKKMFYFGSGAEFDKTLPIVDFREADSQTRMPKDKYGFIKYILNQNAINSDKIYNLRLFGTINPYERYTKNVICNLIAKAVIGSPLNLRQNCCFSFVDIDDVAAIIDYGFQNELRYHDYNVASGTYQLKDIANAINGQFCNGKNTVSFERTGLSKEYTASNDRLTCEFKDFTPLYISLEKIYSHMKDKLDNIDIDMIDSRWKSRNDKPFLATSNSIAGGVIG